MSSKTVTVTLRASVRWWVAPAVKTSAALMRLLGFFRCPEDAALRIGERIAKAIATHGVKIEVS